MTRRELFRLACAAPLAAFVPSLRRKRSRGPFVGGINDATFPFWRNLRFDQYASDDIIYFLNTNGAFKIYGNLEVDNPRRLGMITGITE